MFCKIGTLGKQLSSCRKACYYMGILLYSREVDILNSPLHWLYAQYVGVVPSGNASCYLCGTNCPEQYSTTKSIADTFNSHFLAHCPSSSWMCAACSWYLDGKASHPDFRKMSLLVYRTEWMNWPREQMKSDIERWLVSGLDTDAFLVVSLSKKKHILLQAPLNAAQSCHLAIQVEEQVAHVDLTIWRQINMPFLQLLALGHGKGEVLSGNLYSSTLRKHGCYAEALFLSQQLEMWRNSPQIELLSYVTILQEKETSIDDGDGQSGRDATGGLATNFLPAGTRNQTDRLGPATRCLERDRSRVSQPLSSGNMATVRGESGNSEPDYEQLSLFSE